MTNDTQNTALLEIEEKVHKFAQKRKAKEFAEKIASIVGGAVFFAIAVLTTYFILAIMEEGAWYFEPLTKAWNWFAGIITTPEQTWGAKLGISLGVMYGVTTAITLVISIFVPLLYVKKKFKAFENKTNLKRIESMEAKLNTTYNGGAYFVYAILYALFTTISMIYLMLFYGGNKIDDFAAIIGAVFAIAFCAAISAIVAAVLFGIAIVINSALLSVKEPADLVAEVAALKKKELNRIEFEKAEERRRELREKAELEREEKKKKEKEKEAAKKAREEELKKAKEMYKKAMESDEPDEKLIEEAARIGYPEANLYMGKMYVARWSTSELSERGKEKILKNAESFLSMFSGGGNPTGQFLWLFCNCTLYGHNNKEWKSILARLERLEDEGKVDETFTGTLAMLINEVENKVAVTAIAEVGASKPNGDVVGVPDCKFRNGAICTFKSTSMTIYKCNYVNNPFACIDARDNKGAYFRR